MIEQILAYFRFDVIEIIGISLFFFLFIIQLFYYFRYYKKPYSTAKKRDKDGFYTTEKPKVSVIIVSENEVDSLKENLPFILQQDYPDYEVIVVNNGSTDESDELLRSIELKDKKLYHTGLPYSNDWKLDRRKLALTIGIKAAKSDILLFTEPYCKPVSDKWIESMLRELDPERDVVLGYSFFKPARQFFSRVARFDNLLFSMQYLSQVIRHKPYTGNYRNLLFRKHLFFDNKGFASLLRVANGEELFISRIMTRDNTSVALSHDSFVETNLDDFSLWRQIKRSYFAIRSYLKSSATVFKFEIFSRSIFYMLFIALIIYSVILQNWVLLGIAVFLFLIRLITQLVIINKDARYFMSGKFYFSLIVLDIIQPLYNIRFKSWRKRR
ncbi:MAG: glycosyltransferase [Prevotella sp.]|jgi:glycosyltransferase involved in cell wall biosynthesis|nr:glycosyltransferase [Prevotella sp.]